MDKGIIGTVLVVLVVMFLVYKVTFVRQIIVGA